VLGRGAAASADDGDAEVVHVVTVELGELLRSEVVVRLAVDHAGQSGIRQHADRNRRVLREMPQVFLHLGWPRRAVDADDRRLHRENRSERCADLGAHQHAAGGFHRHLHLDGHLARHRTHRASAALHRGLDLQQVHARLDEQQIGTALDECACVLFVGVA